jgi:Immunoglobulin I-set domain
MHHFFAALPLSQFRPGMNLSISGFAVRLALLLMFFLLAACDGGGGGGGGGGSTATPASVPVISTQPLNQTVAEAQTAQFSVTASGTGLQYQWRRGGVNIAGATGAVYTTAPTTAADNGGVFSVVVSNAAGNVTSATATLTITTVAGVGSLNGLVASAADGAPVAGARAAVLSGPAGIADANGAFTFPRVAANDRVVVRVSAPGFVDTLRAIGVRPGAVTNTRVTLLPVGSTATVNPTSAVTVTVPNSPARVTAAANSFVRADNGTAPNGTLTVQLTPIDPASDPDRMPGDFTAGTGAAVTQIESFGAIAVDIRDAQGNAFNLASGRTATIRIPVSSRQANPPATIPLFYLNETTGRWIEEGTATLAGTGTDRYYEGVVTHFSFWNADIVQETIFVNGCVQTATGTRASNRTVMTNGVDYTGGAIAYTNTTGEFRVAMRRNSQAVLEVSGSVEATAPITVGPSATDITLPQCLIERQPAQLPPTIVTQPANLSVSEFALARFLVVAEGWGMSPTLPLSPLRYQWRRNGLAITGANSAGYTFVATAADNGAVYSVQVTNAFGSVTSSNATLTVTVPNTAPVIVQQPTSAAVQVGQTASFSILASGTPTLTYQWRRGGAPIAGATSTNYVTPATTLADNGAVFDVVVTNGLGSVPSAAATLTVTATQPAVGTYKRQLASLLAATYNAGCVNGTGQGPIVVAGNGDVSWGGGSIPLSSTSSVVAFSNTYGNGNDAGSAAGTAMIFDSANADRFAFSTIRMLSTIFSSVEVSSNVVRCDPGLAGGIPQPNILARVSSWLQGTTASLQCNVTAGGSTTTQSLNLGVASGQVTLGAININLAATRISESVAATDVVVSGGDSMFVYAAEYPDSSTFSVSRFVTSPGIAVQHRTTTGTSYNCNGTR